MKKKIFILLLIPFTLFGQVGNHDPDSVEMTSLLSTLIQFPSTSKKEKKIGEFLTTWCEIAGLKTKVFSDSDSSYNLIASLYPLSSEKPNYIFLSHMDVVDAEENEYWEYPPFAGIINNDTIYGRGAFDNKGPIVMQLIALRNFNMKFNNGNLPYNISVLLVSGEEESDPSGCEFVCENFLDSLHAVAVFGEGGSGLTNIIESKPEIDVFGISVNEKRALWLKLESYAKVSGHSSIGDNELYASKKLIKVLTHIISEYRPKHFGKLTKHMFNEFGEFECGIKRHLLKYPYRWYCWPFMKKYFNEDGIFNTFVSSTISITEITTIKSSKNAIPQSAYAILDCRLLPEDNTEKFIEKIKQKAGKNINVTVLFEGMAAEDSPIGEHFNLMSNAISEHFPNAKTFPYLFPASTDNNIFRANGIPSYGITPILINSEIISRVHNYDEIMPIDQLIKGKKVYYSLMKLIQGIE